MKETNPECLSCAARVNENLYSFADLVEKVYISDAFDSLPLEEYAEPDAEDKIRRGKITSDDIDRLTPDLTADIDLTLAGCFVDLHPQARANQEALAALTEEGKVAVAGCATLRLQRRCEQQL